MNSPKITGTYKAAASQESIAYYKASGNDVVAVKYWRNTGHTYDVTVGQTTDYYAACILVNELNDALGVEVQ